VKVIPASEMARVEREAYEKGASGEAFMEAAGRGIAEVVQEVVRSDELEWQAAMLCGKGNNAGDAYVAGCYLIEQGYAVRALQLAPIEEASLLCQKNHARFVEAGGEVVSVEEEEELSFFDDGIILDGVFGTGFKGQVEGIFAAAFRRANISGLPVIAIDIPSGINGDTGESGGVAIEAHTTVFLGLPKSGFFLGEGWNHVGHLHPVDFGLDQEFIDDARPDFIMLIKHVAAQLLPPIVRNRHKYESGYVVGVAGSKEMPGAAILSSSAALRSGAGMVRLLHSPDIQPHALGLPAEVLAHSLASAADADSYFEKASALFIGPGLGTDAATADLLRELLGRVKCPCVLDADALTLIAEGDWTFPEHTVITPHRGEMRRLLGHDDLHGPDMLKACQDYVNEKNVTLVLKGGPTFVFLPKPLNVPWVVTRGDAGMATAGCGDVLTGVIAAFLAQGLRPGHAALVGAYLHGTAGEYAADELTSYSIAASDVTDHLPDAFVELIAAKWG
jgi:ADP-dependent NAD(P)H-hydrate dehydratase / NAD(P)H-hydrate epimerase